MAMVKCTPNPSARNRIGRKVTSTKPFPSLARADTALANEISAPYRGAEARTGVLFHTPSRSSCWPTTSRS